MFRLLVEALRLVVLALAEISFLEEVWVALTLVVVLRVYLVTVVCLLVVQWGGMETLALGLVPLFTPAEMAFRVGVATSEAAPTMGN
jgi:hypothetical protein